MEEPAAEQLPGLPEPIPGMPDMPGPFPVGRYAAKLRVWFRQRAKVMLEGEVTGLRVTAKAVYFELRDADGAVPCSMWRNSWDGLDLPAGAVADGTEVVLAGGLDYYPGSATASPSFSFRATHLRPAGEGDLLRRLAELKRQLHKEGLFEPQRALPRPLIPAAIGVITGRDSAAKADIVAGLKRRGWGGTVVFAHPPVQDRRASGQIGQALQDLAGRPEIETIIVTRGGGSLADLWAFCDETLCRTVALLRVPVIAAVGHESDETLIDSVAAVSCSTPTHATQEAIRVDINEARAGLRQTVSQLRAHGADAVRRDIGDLRRIGRTLAHHLDSQRSRLHQLIREVRAAADRGLERRGGDNRTRGIVLERKQTSTTFELSRRGAELTISTRRLARHSVDAHAIGVAHLDRLAQTLDAHHPDRVLERGFALVEDREGGVVTGAAAARKAGRVHIRFSGDSVEAEVDPNE